MKILVVDDDSSLAFLVKTFLSPYGDADVVDDGDKAVDAIVQALDAGEPYEVMTLDIMMPTMNGLEALRLIREAEVDRGIAEDQRMKIIMVSVKDDAETITQSHELGADTFLAKDRAMKELPQTLAMIGVEKP